MTESNAQLAEEINSLKNEKKAVILAHNYQLGEVQDIADFVGDSLELSRIAADSNADVIVFCGVQFMAETASILCPDKKILLPEASAGCQMADMLTAAELKRKKAELPGAAVVAMSTLPPGSRRSRISAAPPPTPWRWLPPSKATASFSCPINTWGTTSRQR